MKTRHVMGILLILAGILLLAGQSQAHTAPGGACVQVDGALADDHHFTLVRDTNPIPMCAAGPHEGFPLNNWQMNAGGCKQIKYFFIDEGVGSPLDPNLVQIEIRFDDTATVIKTLHNGAQPVNNTAFTFCATTTGNAGDPGRAGTYRIFLRVVKNDAPGGIGNYDENSDTDGHRGAIRARITATSLTASSPPAGSFFAYNIPSESVVITTGHTQPNGDNNREVIRTDSINDPAGGVRETGALNDRDGISYTQSFIIDNTYSPTILPYGARAVISEEAALTEGQGAFSATEQLWTVWRSSGHGTGILVLDNTTVRRFGLFNADPRLRIDAHSQASIPLVKDDFPSDNMTEDESYVISVDVLFGWCHVANARLEDLNTVAGTVTMTVRDPSDVVQETLTTETQSDGWTSDDATGRIEFPAVAPGGIWTLRCAVTVTGNSGSVDQDVQFISAFTANLVLRLLVPTNQPTNETFRVYVRTEINDGARTPDTLPTLTVSYVEDSQSLPVWTDILTNVSMLNVVDNTPTVVGSLYYLNVSLPREEVFNFRAIAILQGAGIRAQSNIEGHDMIEILGFDLGTAIGLLFWLSLFVLSLHKAWGMVSLTCLLSFAEPISPSLGLDPIASLLALFLGFIMHAVFGPFSMFSLTSIRNAFTRKEDTNT